MTVEMMSRKIWTGAKSGQGGPTKIGSPGCSPPVPEVVLRGGGVSVKHTVKMPT